VLITTNISSMLAMAQKLLADGHIDQVIIGDDAVYGPLPAPMQPPIPEARGIILFSALLAAPLPAEWPALHPDDLAVLQYTGGTTGMPKGAMHTHATLLAAAAIYDQFYLAQSAGDEATPQRVIAVLPFFHIYALCVLLLWQMQRGALLFLHLRFDPHAILRDIEVKRATYFPGVPTMWIALNAIPGIETRDFSSLRNVASGGAPLPLEVAERFERLVGTRIGGGWGMTETAAAGTAHLMQGMFKPTSVGVPLPGFAVRIVALDEPARVLGLDETGEIAVRGPNVFTGYWQHPEATARDFVDGWFLTGDIGRLDADGMVYILDRKKDMIISGGFNVYPTMIEAAIYEHADVAECIVIGIPDAYRGQAAKAFIKLRENATEFSLESLNEFLADKIGRHELPAALEFRAELPKTPVGKLSKKELIAEAAMIATEQKHG
jgi:long-chain acyl-CoA synthetase